MLHNNYIRCHIQGSWVKGIQDSKYSTILMTRHWPPFSPILKEVWIEFLLLLIERELTSTVCHCNEKKIDKYFLNIIFGCVTKEIKQREILFSFLSFFLFLLIFYPFFFFFFFLFCFFLLLHRWFGSKETECSESVNKKAYIVHNKGEKLIFAFSIIASLMA